MTGRWTAGFGGAPSAVVVAALAVAVSLGLPGVPRVSASPFGPSGFHRAAPTVPLYEVNVTEYVFAAGTAWNLTVGATTWTTNRTYLAIEEPNGSYRFSAVAAGTIAPTYQGIFSVDGAPVGVPVTPGDRVPGGPGNSTSAGAASGSASPSAALGSLLAVLIVLIVTVAVVLGVVARRRSRGERDRSRAPEPAEPERAGADHGPDEDDPLRHML